MRRLTGILVAFLLATVPARAAAPPGPYPSGPGVQQIWVQTMLNLLYTGGGGILQADGSGQVTAGGPLLGRSTYNYTPIFDLASNLLSVNELFTATAVSVPANANYNDIRSSQANGANNTYTIGPGAVVASFYAQPEALSGSDATSNLYAASINAFNDGPGSVKGVHTGCFANTGSTGVCIGVNSQVQPVSTSGYTAALFTSLSSSGINNVAIGLGIESLGDQYLEGICGGCVAPLPIDKSFIHWTVASSTAVGARFLQLYNSSSVEIAYWDKSGNVLTPTAVLTAAAPTVSASQIGYGGTVTANTNCGTLASSAGCVVINVAGTIHYIPYY